MTAVGVPILVRRLRTAAATAALAVGLLAAGPPAHAAPAAVCPPAGSADHAPGSDSYQDWTVNGLRYARQYLWISRHYGDNACHVDKVRGDTRVVRVRGAAVGVNWVRLGTSENAVVGGLPTRNETDVWGIDAASSSTVWEPWTGPCGCLGYRLYASGGIYMDDGQTIWWANADGVLATGDYRPL